MIRMSIVLLSIEQTKLNIQRIVYYIVAVRANPRTPCLKKGTSMLSIVTLKRINGLQRFLAQIFLIQLAIK